MSLDAWDELRDGYGVLVEYFGPYVASTAAKVLGTSRITGYAEHGAPFPTEGPNPAALRICPFERPDTQAFIARFFSRDKREQEIGRRLSGELRSKVPVAGLAENPLLTTLLCMAYWPDPLGEWPGQLVIKEGAETDPPHKG